MATILDLNTHISATELEKMVRNAGFPTELVQIKTPDGKIREFGPKSSTNSSAWGSASYELNKRTGTISAKSDENSPKTDGTKPAKSTKLVRKFQVVFGATECTFKFDQNCQVTYNAEARTFWTNSITLSTYSAKLSEIGSKLWEILAGADQLDENGQVIPEKTGWYLDEIGSEKSEYGDACTDILNKAIATNATEFIQKYCVALATKAPNTIKKVDNSTSPKWTFIARFAPVEPAK
jgi:hypothetical protein